MYYSLTGKLAHRGVDDAVVVCGGVGYHVVMPSEAVAALPTEGEVTVYTHLNVKEDAMELFGFDSVSQRDVFTMLISVSGVGPKVGIAILNALSPMTIMLAIASADHKMFTKANGVGPKLAQRIVLELKDKSTQLELVSDTGAPMVMISGSSGNMAQALAALEALGYSKSESAVALKGCTEDLPVQDLIRVALRNINN